MQYPTNFLVIDFQSQSSQLQSIRYFQIIPHDVEKFIARDIYNRYQDGYNLSENVIEK